MSSCVASHFPPQEKAGGGAAATASSTAWISPATSSARCRRRPVVSSAEAVANVGKRLPGRVSVAGGAVQLSGFCCRAPVLDCQRHQSDTARVGGLRQVVLPRLQRLRVGLRRSGEPGPPFLQAC